MVDSPIFGIRLMATNDLQKEVIFNEATVLLEAMAARNAKNRQNSPPGSPANGDMYIIGTAGTGAWLGHNNKIALYFNGWRIYSPVEKIKVYNQTTSTFWTYSAGGWTQDPAGTPSTLNDLTDVAGTPTDGQALIYNETAGEWQPTTLPSQSNLSDLPDVDITGGLADGQFLGWDESESKWVPMTPSAGGGASQLADLSDVDMSGGEPGDGYILTWDADADHARFVEYEFPAASLNDFTDVNTAGAVANDGLIWNGSIWAPSSVAMNYSFGGMLDGPGTMENFAGHFLVVDPTESFLEFRSLQDLIDDLDDFRLQDLTDVQAPGDSHIGKVLTLAKTGSDFHYTYTTPVNYSISGNADGVALTTRILSLRFDGFDVDETSEGNLVITALNALGFEDSGVPIVGDVNAINFTGGISATYDAGTLNVDVTFPDIVAALSDLTDVDVTTDPPLDGEVLKWDGINSKWVPGTGGGGGVPMDGEAAPALYELGPFAPPTAGMFPNNLGAPSADVTPVPNRGLLVQGGPQTSGVKHAVLWRTLVNNEEPWIVTCRVIPNSLQVNGHASGIVLKRAFNNSFFFLTIGNSEGDTQHQIRSGWVSGTGTETIILTEPNFYPWLRLAFDGNFIRAWVSSDGLIWQNFGAAHDPGTSLGGSPDRVGLTQRTNETNDGNCGGLYTYYEDPDFPAAPRIQMGIVALSMSGLQDVDFTTPPTTGQAMLYDEITETWLPGNPSATVETLAIIGDVDADGIADGQVLVWDEGTSTWIPGNAGGGALADLSDVDLTVPPEDGWVLTWDEGTSTWIAAVSAGGASYPDMTGHEGKVLAVNGTEDGVEWVERAPMRYTVNPQSGNYTLVLADADGVYVRMNVATANTLTVPNNSTAAIPIGSAIPIKSAGAGQTTIVAAGGVTINSPETLKLRKQHSGATLIKVGTNEWDLTGDLELAP